jgi:hypothetical protein
VCVFSKKVFTVIRVLKFHVLLARETNDLSRFLRCMFTDQRGNKLTVIKHAKKFSIKVTRGKLLMKNEENRENERSFIADIVLCTFLQQQQQQH